MSEDRYERGDLAWNWVVKVGCFGVFIYAAVWKEDTNFMISFLAICGAVFPAREFRRFLRSWRYRGDGST